jgi:hypothetical protein
MQLAELEAKILVYSPGASLLKTLGVAESFGAYLPCGLLGLSVHLCIGRWTRGFPEFELSFYNYLDLSNSIRFKFEFNFQQSIIV